MLSCKTFFASGAEAASGQSIVLGLAFVMILLIIVGYSRSLDSNHDLVEIFQGHHISFQNSTMVMQTTLALFHVGKTGGTTLRDNVLRIGCRAKKDQRKKIECQNRQLYRNSVTQPESKLSHFTRMFFHYQHSFPASAAKLLNTTHGLLFTVREPLARFENAYYYHSPFHCFSGDANKPKKDLTENEKFCYRNQNDYFHPRDPKSDYHSFYETFPTLEHLIDALQGSSTENGADAARQKKLLQKTFKTFGRTLGYGHMTAGYRYYVHWLARLPERIKSASAKVFAIRTERLWADAEAIDVILGGSGNFSALSNAKHTHGSEQQINRTKIAEDHGSDTVLPLRCALFPDMQAYRLIVDNALNLNDRERRETYSWTWNRCSVELGTVGR